MTLTTPFPGWFVIRRLTFTMANLCTKLDSISSGYEDM